MTLTEGGLAGRGRDFKVALDPVASALSPMRHDAARWLHTWGVTSATIDDLLLVLSELCTNAIEATTLVDEPILVGLRMADTTVDVEVDSPGPPFDEHEAVTRQQANSNAERGRGLAIVRAVADEVALQFHDGRCVVRAVVPVSGAEGTARSGR